MRRSNSIPPASPAYLVESQVLKGRLQELLDDNTAALRDVRSSTIFLPPPPAETATVPETAAVIADILEWRRGQDDALLEAKRRVEVLQRSEGELSTAWKDAMTSPFWAGEQKVTSEQNLSVLGDAAQRRAQICAQQALHASPCEDTLLALDDARGHLKSVAVWKSTSELVI